MDIASLYSSCIRRLQRMLTRMLGGNSAHAADVAHDAFLRVYAAELGERTELSATLLFVAAKRLALNELRNAARRRTDADDRIDDLVPASDEHEPSRLLESDQALRCLQSAIDSMPPQCRRVLVMRRIEGRSHAEIAAALQIAPKTVERHLTRALHFCHEHLAAQGLASREAPARRAEARR